MQDKKHAGHEHRRIFQLPVRWEIYPKILRFVWICGIICLSKVSGRGKGPKVRTHTLWSKLSELYRLHNIYIYMYKLFARILQIPNLVFGCLGTNFIWRLLHIVTSNEQLIQWLKSAKGSEKLSCDDLISRLGYVVIIQFVKMCWASKEFVCGICPSEVRLYYSQITAGLYFATMVLVWGLSHWSLGKPWCLFSSPRNVESGKCSRTGKQQQQQGIVIIISTILIFLILLILILVIIYNHQLLILKGTQPDHSNCEDIRFI